MTKRRKNKKYRVKSGRPIERRDYAELGAVQFGLRKRGDGMALAMAFDPGEVPTEQLLEHAGALMLGLLRLRGWRGDKQEFLLGLANDWTDQWWEPPLTSNAFVIESDLRPTGPATAPDDMSRIVNLTKLAWSMEHELHLQERPTPDLMMTFADDGVVLANIHPEPLRDAMHGQRASIAERLSSLPEAERNPTHAHVLMHLEGTSVRPWTLPGGICAFASRDDDPAIHRVFVALQDTSPNPQPETARSLLRMMLASGTDD